jgi:DNA-binding NarL/FixJ family response regulator
MADDHELLLDGMRKLLEPHFEILAAVTNGRILVQEVIRLRPDVTLLDIGMPDLNGIEAARQLQSEAPDVKLIFVTQKTEREYIRAAFLAGARGYVLKQSAGSELFIAINEVMERRYYLSPVIARETGTEFLDPGINPAPLVGGKLTGRQREVLQLIAEGKSVKETAHLLGISSKTVEFHKGVIMGQLGVRTIAELTRYAIEHRIITL